MLHQFALFQSGAGCSWPSPSPGPVKSPFAKGAPALVGLVPPGPKQQPSLPKDGGVLNDARQEGLESGCSLYSSYREQSLHTVCARLKPLPLLFIRQGAQVFGVVPTSLPRFIRRPLSSGGASNNGRYSALRSNGVRVAQSCHKYGAHICPARQSANDTSRVPHLPKGDGKSALQI